MTEPRELTEYPTACAHMRVVYNPVKHSNGTKSDRWICDSCSAEFSTTAPLQSRLEEKEREAIERTRWLNEKEETLGMQCRDIDRLRSSLADSQKENATLKADNERLTKKADGLYVDWCSMRDVVSPLRSEVDRLTKENTKYHIVNDVNGQAYIDQQVVASALRSRLSEAEKAIHKTYWEYNPSDGSHYCVHCQASAKYPIDIIHAPDCIVLKIKEATPK